MKKDFLAVHDLSREEILDLIEVGLRFKREEEITSGVSEGPHSVVFDQVENKLHLHMAPPGKVDLQKIRRDEAGSLRTG
jgi:ornithine carbamoyltransferase